MRWSAIGTVLGSDWDPIWEILVTKGYILWYIGDKSLESYWQNVI